MPRSTGFADLAGRRVGVYGYGLEGRAAAERLRALGAEVVVVDDSPVDGALLTADGGRAALEACDVVLKTPGVPRRRSDVVALEESGVRVTSALNLWLHDVDRSRVVCVTGTKGKSTTTALITFFLQCVGERAQSLGNIGRPPYGVDIDDASGWLVVEVSSFQCVDLDVAPATIVLTSLGADHLDWHGSLDDYHEAKLSLTRRPGARRTLVADSPELHAAASRLGGEVTFVVAHDHGLAAALSLLGAHNVSNVALALAATASLLGRDVDAVAAAVVPHASEFAPLRGRLTLVATEDDGPAVVRYVDDGLATSPLPAVAALAVFADDPVALIAGGFDRGVDYAPLADAIGARRATTSVVLVGPAGARLGAELATRAPRVTASSAESMAGAIDAARASLVSGGVVLLSPGAPSFDAYRNWEERSADFTAIVRTRLRAT